MLRKKKSIDIPENVSIDLRLEYHRGEGRVKWSDRFLTRSEALVRNHLVLDKVELQHVHLGGISVSNDVCGCAEAK